MPNSEISDPQTPTKWGGGAKPGNKNATRHGLRASSMPKGCGYLQSQLTAFRRYIRHEIVLRDGRTTTYQEAILQSATRHETRAALAGRWLRIEGETLTIDQRVMLLRELGNATDARDRCLRFLGLDRDARKDALDALYGPAPDPVGNETRDPATTESPESPTTSPTARSSTSGGEGGENIPRKRERLNVGHVCDNQEEEEDDENV